MRYQAKVPPEVSQAIRGFGLSREALVTVLNWLYLELEEGHADSYRHNPDHRAPHDPERYVWGELTVWDHGKPREFRFTIDDATAPDLAARLRGFPKSRR